MGFLGKAATVAAVRALRFGERMIEGAMALAFRVKP